jgi:hypothetical protein
VLQLGAEGQAKLVRNERDLVLDEGGEEMILALFRIDRKCERPVDAVVDEAVAEAGAEDMPAEAGIALEDVDIERVQIEDQALFLAVVPSVEGTGFDL